jgi:protein-tyrosine phosphatase
VIDLHSHILPGLDDGAQTLADSVELARAAAAGGVRAIAGTPHVRHDYPTTVDEMEEALAAVRTAVADEGIPIEILPGGELALEWVNRLTPDELRRFGLGGNPAYVLVEMPYLGWPLGLERIFRGLLTNGITPVLAHPERNPEAQTDLDRVGLVAREGALIQLTAASLDGRGGRRARAAALKLVEQGVAHLVASDAHGASVRAVGFDGVLDAVGDESLAHWLTEGVPSAIVNGTVIPVRPEGPHHRSWLPRRRR